MSKKKVGLGQQLHSFWQGLSPKTKKKITVSIVLTAFISISLLGYYATHRSNSALPSNQVTKQGKAIDIQLQPGLLQATINNKVSQQLKKMQQQVSLLQKQLKSLQAGASTTTNQQTTKTSTKTTNGVILNKQQTTKSAPPVPVPRFGGGQPMMGGGVPRKALKQGAVLIGSIGIARNNSAKNIAKLGSIKKKKASVHQEVYLPTCFMEASLLSGLDAPTMNGAKGNPVPVLLRVRAPAILPNRVKANLKGCFIIAEGYGDLASERVYLRLVNLSCIARNGQAVIDQPIKGFVVGSDGKIGLRGRVVSKMGAVLARAALAGFLQGFGNAVNSSSWTTWTSSVGTGSTINAGDVGRAALGGGLSAASKKLAEFYMKLADQTLPVIEVGATRRVTVVVSQGTMLKLRNVCIGGEKCR